MASVVFFRAVNVGAHQRFQPRVLARELADFGVVSIGTAGTFVVQEDVSPNRLRVEILRRLAFVPELIICPARDVLDLARADSFGDVSADPGLGQFVSVMQKVPAVRPTFPLQYPEGPQWEVRLVALMGRFALSVRRKSQRNLYPNAIVEKEFGIPATTRNWNTFATILRTLENPHVALR